jgi:3-oxoacyl-[acyl-carrier-protein] synthase II
VYRAERRVVVTGMGMITPVGLDLESSWNALREGQGGVGPISLFDAASFPTRIAAKIKGFGLEREFGADAVFWEGHNRNTQIALAAAKQAMDHSGFLDYHERDPGRFGVYLASGEGQEDFSRFVDLVHRSSVGARVDTARFTQLGVDLLDPILEAEQEPGTPSGHLAGIFGARGPNVACLTACAASAQAIGKAAELIPLGVADAMLAGSVHSMIHRGSRVSRVEVARTQEAPSGVQSGERPHEQESPPTCITDGRGQPGAPSATLAGRQPSLGLKLVPFVRLHRRAARSPVR